MIQTSNEHRGRYALFGVVFVLFLVALAVFTVLQFTRSFTPSSTLRLHTSRAGLLLEDGGTVKLRGVTVGRVDHVAVSGDGAVLTLAVDPDRMQLIPSDVTARIVPPTFFGGKYVELSAPSGDTSDAIAPGATIDASHVTVEINDTFQHLMDLLQAAKPAQVNAALTALATGLDGKGDDLGRLITKLDTYLKGINPSLGTLASVLPKAKSVLGTYSKATPDLLRTARNTTRVSDTIQAHSASLDAFLLSLTSVSTRTTAFLNRTGPNLITAMDVLQPTLRTLARYSPQVPCFFEALAGPALPVARALLGGTEPALTFETSFLPPETPYLPATDKPRIGADVGPRCYGMPYDYPTTAFHENFDVGTDPYQRAGTATGLTPKSLLQLLFGPLKGAAS